MTDQELREAAEQMIKSFMDLVREQGRGEKGIDIIDQALDEYEDSTQIEIEISCEYCGSTDVMHSLCIDGEETWICHICDEDF